MSVSTEGRLPTKRYLTLDGLRGIAAIMVLTRHCIGSLDPIHLHSSFLAVDLFFVMSGFVMAETYESRLRSGALSTGEFVRIRYIRLWPLYFLGAILGLVLLAVRIRSGDEGMSWLQFVQLVPLALLMLPSPATPSFAPWSMVSWSLFFEIGANFAWSAICRFARTWILALVAGASAFALIAAVRLPDGADNGFVWSTAWVGLARVCYSFTVGLLISRYRERLPDLRVPSYAILGGTGVVLGAPALAPTLQWITIVMVLPVIVIFAVQSEPTARFGRACAFLGATSYGIYVLHPQIYAFGEMALGGMGSSLRAFAPVSGLCLAGAIVVMAWAADRWYDRRVRTWLSREWTSTPGQLVGEAHGFEIPSQGVRALRAKP